MFLLVQVRRMSTNTVLFTGNYQGGSGTVCGSAGDIIKFTIFDSYGDGKYSQCAAHAIASKCAHVHVIISNVPTALYLNTDTGCFHSISAVHLCLSRECACTRRPGFGHKPLNADQN